MKLQKQITENAVSPVVGVILMVAVTFVFIGAIVLGLVFLTSSQLELGQYFTTLVIAYIAIQAVLRTVNYYITIKANPIDYIEFEQHSQSYEDTEIKTASISLEIPDSLNLKLEEPYIIAPAHADPRDWAPITQLENEDTLRFVINHPTAPDAQEDTYLPDKHYGPVNATYTVDEIKELVVYDTNYDEVAHFTIK